MAFSRAAARKGLEIEITAHPTWVQELLAFLAPHKDKVVNSRIFRELAAGTLSLKRFPAGLVNFYPLVEGFPKYMGLDLAKVPQPDTEWNKKTRYWLIININVERMHTEWWKNWAVGLGVSRAVFGSTIVPPPEIDAINNYLWNVCTHGTLLEGIAASNFAIEGPTGEWTKNVKKGILKYRSAPEVHLDTRALEWLNAHSSYDDKHPFEALEIIKAYATTQEEQQKVRQAAKRGMEYYATALKACYDLFA